MVTLNIVYLTGAEADAAVEQNRRELAALKKEITRRGGKTFEGVTLTPDGGLTSAVTVEEVDGG